MKPVMKGDIPLLQENELAWAQGHLDVPQARRVVERHERSLRGEIDIDGDELREAVIALREVHPRPPQVIDRIFTYLGYDPLNRVEAAIEANPAKGGFPMLFAALDLMHMRTLLDEAHAIQRQTPHPLRLWSFKLDRTIPDHKIPHIRSVNPSMRRCEEIFAYIANLEGDEVIAAVAGPNTKPQVMMTISAEGAKGMQRYAKGLAAHGMPIELRRFVRDYEVLDVEFNLRPAAHA